MHRREETEFHPDSAHQYIHMAVDWLMWEAAQTGKSIRYHFYDWDKRIGKLPVDGLCQETRTAH